MGLGSQLCTCMSVGVALLAILIGLCAAGVPRWLGVFAWLAGACPELVGMSPAFLDGVAPNFDFERLGALDLSGQRAVVTGANSGLGLATSLHLARQGAEVVLACRNPSKCDAAAASIRRNATDAKVQTLTLDTSDLDSVRSFSASLLDSGDAIDMLYLNAGIAGATVRGEALTLDKHGVEAVFSTNVVGHHLLYKLTLPLLERAPRARVVLTASAANFATYPYGVATDLETLNGGDAGSLYGQSKFAQVVWAQEATRQLGADSSVTVNSCHPGAVDTGIWDQLEHLLGPTLGPPVRSATQLLQDQFMFTAEEGALTQLWLGAAEHNSRGLYYHPQAQLVSPNPLAKNQKLGEDLWEFLDKLVE